MDNNLEKMKALALAAPSIQTWQERMPEHVRQLGTAASESPYKDAEIVELRSEVERLRARFGYIEGNATTSGGGHGFEVRFFVPEDSEDIGCGIDAAIEKEKA